MPIKCSFEGCPNPHYAKGLCHPHYYQQYRGQSLSPIKDKTSRDFKICKVIGCNKTHYARGYCRNHYSQHRNNSKTLNLLEEIAKQELQMIDPAEELRAVQQKINRLEKRKQELLNIPANHPADCMCTACLNF